MEEDNNIFEKFKKSPISLLSVIGFVMTIAGTIMPLVTLLGTSAIYIQGDGKILCALAIVGIVFIIFNKDQFALIPAVINGLILFDYAYGSDVKNEVLVFQSGYYVMWFGIGLSVFGCLYYIIKNKDRVVKKITFKQVFVTVIILFISIIGVSFYFANGKYVKKMFTYNRYTKTLSVDELIAEAKKNGDNAEKIDYPPKIEISSNEEDVKLNVNYYWSNTEPLHVFIDLSSENEKNFKKIKAAYYGLFIQSLIHYGIPKKTTNSSGTDTYTWDKGDYSISLSIFMWGNEKMCSYDGFNNK